MSKSDRVDLLIEALKEYDEATLGLALMYARNMTLYGVDVTEKWDTVTQQSAAVHQAYTKGLAEGIGSTKL